MNWVFNPRAASIHCRACVQCLCHSWGLLEYITQALLNISVIANLIIMPDHLRWPSTKQQPSWLCTAYCEPLVAVEGLPWCRAGARQLRGRELLLRAQAQTPVSFVNSWTALMHSYEEVCLYLQPCANQAQRYQIILTIFCMVQFAVLHSEDEQKLKI